MSLFVLYYICYIYPHIGGIKAALDLKNSNGILMGERSSSYGCMGSGFGCGNVWNPYKIIDKLKNQILYLDSCGPRANIDHLKSYIEVLSTAQNAIINNQEKNNNFLSKSCDHCFHNRSSQSLTFVYPSLIWISF